MSYSYLRHGNTQLSKTVQEVQKQIMKTKDQIKNVKEQSEKLIIQIKQRQSKVKELQNLTPQIKQDLDIANLTSSFMFNPKSSRQLMSSASKFGQSSKQQKLQLIEQIEGQIRQKDAASIQKRVNLQTQYLRKKVQYLRNLDKLKVQSNMYTSHKRVLIKQFLEYIRGLNNAYKVKSDNLQIKLQDFDRVKHRYLSTIKQIEKISQNQSIR